MIAAGYHRWFDYKWGREFKESQRVKTRLICGVKTPVAQVNDRSPSPRGGGAN